MVVSRKQKDISRAAMWPSPTIKNDKMKATVWSSSASKKIRWEPRVVVSHRQKCKMGVAMWSPPIVRRHAGSCCVATSLNKGPVWSPCSRGWLWSLWRDALKEKLYEKNTCYVKPCTYQNVISLCDFIAWWFFWSYD